MAKILYGPTTIDAPNLRDVSVIKAGILKAVSEGKYNWFEYVADNANVSLLVGPGIPFAIVDDAPDKAHPDLSDQGLADFIKGDETE